MKSTFKKPLIFFGSIVLILLSLHCFAQPRGMTMGQVNHIVGQQSRQMNNGLQNNVWMGWGWSAGKVDKYKYQVTFKDSAIKEVVSFMYMDTVSHKSFLVFVDKKFPKSDILHRNQKIFADQTLYISTITDPDANTETYGVPTDSCWMFKVINGPISVYAKCLSYLTMGQNQYEQEFNMWEIVGIQLKDGPIVKLTNDNLRQMVAQDTNALEALENKKYYRAVKRYNRHAKKADKKEATSGE